MVGNSVRAFGLIGLIAAVAAIPLFTTDIQLLQFTNVGIYAIALLGMNVLMGYNGQISFGHGAFYAIGAYTMAILITHFAVPHWLALPVVAAVAFVAGVLFALPTRRLDRTYLALATFTLGAVLPHVARYPGLERWTGGSQGLGLDQPATPFGLPLSFDQWLFLLTLSVLVLLMLVTANLMRGRIGRAIIAVRDHSVAAQAMGINVALYKSVTFGISAIYTGIAGALGALAILYVSPAIYTIFLSFSFIIGSAVGGIATLSGAIYGAIFLQVILFLAGTAAKTLQTAHVYAIYGVVLILVIYLLPGGVAGLVAAGWSRLRGAGANSNV